MGYPIITHEALNEFTDDTKRLNHIKQEPITIHRPDQPVKDSKLIYPVESGLVPHYTGHIPGKIKCGSRGGDRGSGHPPPGKSQSYMVT